MNPAKLEVYQQYLHIIDLDGLTGIKILTDHGWKLCHDMHYFLTAFEDFVNPNLDILWEDRNDECQMDCRESVRGNFMIPLDQASNDAVNSLIGSWLQLWRDAFKETEAVMGIPFKESHHRAITRMRTIISKLKPPEKLDDLYPLEPPHLNIPRFRNGD